MTEHCSQLLVDKQTRIRFRSPFVGGRKLHCEVGSSLCRFAVVEVEQAAEAAVAFDRPGSGQIGVGSDRELNDVFFPLMRALPMVMFDELIEGALERWFAEEN